MSKTTFTYKNRNRGFGLVGCLALLLSSITSSVAQTLPLLRQRSDVASYYNPAALAPLGVGQIMGIIGSEGQRNNYYLLLTELPGEFQSWVYKAGGQLLYSRQDLWEWSSFTLRSALQLSLSPYHNIQVGVEGAVYRLTFDGKRAIEEGVTNTELPTTKSEDKAFNLGLGVQYYGERLSAGVAITNILNSQLHIGSGYVSQLHPRYIASLNYRIGSTAMWSFIPAIFGGYDQDNKWQVDLKTSLWYHNRIALGAVYRWKEAYGIQMQLRLGSVSLGYQLEQTYLYPNRYSHELFLSYLLTSGKTKQKAPRYKSIRPL